MNAQTLEWNDLYLVLAICREGTLSGAARVLNVNHSTVFRRISSIEDKLGIQLFDRHPTGYVMTKAGEATFEIAKRIDNDVLSLSRELIGRDLQLRGTIRVAAPDALLNKILMPYFKSFSQLYPDIQLELFVSNNYLNLTKREADLAIRVTTSPPDTAVGRRICSMATAIYASNDYITKQASSIEDYTWIMPDETLEHLPITKWQRVHYPNATTLVRCNSILALYDATLEGMGISSLPCFLADPDHRLSRIIAPPVELTSELWLLTHPDLRRTARVQALMKFLSNGLEKEKLLIEGKAVD